MTGSGTGNRIGAALGVALIAILLGWLVRSGDEVSADRETALLDSGTGERSTRPEPGRARGPTPSEPSALTHAAGDIEPVAPAESGADKPTIADGVVRVRVLEVLDAKFAATWGPGHAETVPDTALGPAAGARVVIERWVDGALVSVNAATTDADGLAELATDLRGGVGVIARIDWIGGAVRRHAVVGNADPARVVVPRGLWTLRGRVVLDPSGDPAAGYEVRSDESAVTTTAEGTFELPRAAIWGFHENLKYPVSIPLQLRSPEGLRRAVMTRLPSGKPVELKFQRESGRLELSVTNMDGEPIEGVRLRCRAWGEVGLDRDITTDAAGRGRLEGLPPGRLQLNPREPGTLRGPTTETFWAVQITGSETTQLEIRLRPTHTVKIQVVGADGLPASRVELRFRETGPFGGLSNGGYTDADGRIAFSRVVDWANVKVSCSTRLGSWEWQGASLAALADPVLVVRLTNPAADPGVIEGTATVGTRDFGYRGMAVYLRRLGDPGVGRKYPKTFGEAFRLELEPGRYEVLFVGPASCTPVRLELDTGGPPVEVQFRAASLSPVTLDAGGTREQRQEYRLRLTPLDDPFGFARELDRYGDLAHTHGLLNALPRSPFAIRVSPGRYRAELLDRRGTVVDQAEFVAPSKRPLPLHLPE